MEFPFLRSKQVLKNEDSSEFRAFPYLFQDYRNIPRHIYNVQNRESKVSKITVQATSLALRSIIDGNPVVNIIILSLDKGESSLQLRD